MSGVCCAWVVLLLAKHHAVGTQYVIESVASQSEFHAEVLLAQDKQLTAACLRQIVRGSDILAVPYYARDQNVLLIGLLLMFVVSLSCYAKQLTQGIHLIDANLLCQECNYLASEFFLIGMAYFCSAISIIFS